MKHDVQSTSVRRQDERTMRAAEGATRPVRKKPTATRDFLTIDLQGDERLRSALAETARERGRTVSNLVRHILRLAVLEGHIKNLPV